MNFTLLVEKTRTGYSGYVAEYSGRIIATGDSEDQVVERLREAISYHQKEGDAPDSQVHVISVAC